MATSFSSDRTFLLGALSGVCVANQHVECHGRPFLLQKAIKTFGSLLRRKQTHHLIFTSHVIRWRRMETRLRISMLRVALSQLAPPGPSYLVDTHREEMGRDRLKQVSKTSEFLGIAFALSLLVLKISKIKYKLCVALGELMFLFTTFFFFTNELHSH